MGASLAPGSLPVGASTKLVCPSVQRRAQSMPPRLDQSLWHQSKRSRASALAELNEALYSPNLTRLPPI